MNLANQQVLFEHFQPAFNNSPKESLRISKNSKQPFDSTARRQHPQLLILPKRASRSMHSCTSNQLQVRLLATHTGSTIISNNNQSQPETWQGAANTGKSSLQNDQIVVKTSRSQPQSSKSIANTIKFQRSSYPSVTSKQSEMLIQTS